MRREWTIDAWHFRADDDGRTVDGRIVPYNTPTVVVEADPSTGQPVKYREQFLPGSCAYMVQSAKRRGNASWISLLINHTPGDFNSNIGHAQSLREEDDGAYATFRLYETENLVKVVSMLRESHTGLSVNFADRVPPEFTDDLISRRQVHIDHVAATPTPAYRGAKILAMREDTELPPFDTPHLDAVKAWLEEMKRVPV